jgi:isopenicillin-N epimerase
MSSGTPLRSRWLLDPEVRFLNHGSFGACPRPVLEVQSELRAELEREPVRFLARELEGHLDAAKQELGAFLGAPPEDLVPVANATTAVSAVLRSLALGPGDELLVTNHGYNACRNAVDFVAGQAGARVVVARVPFPIRSGDEVLEAVLERAGKRTRLALVDHVTSPTGLIYPIERIVHALRERGIETLVDGAHAPGMLPLDIAALDPAYYTGNCHKWLCAPKGAAFLYVRRDLQGPVRPVVISHGMNSPRTDRSRFRLEFDWTGTDDPTAFLCVPHALRFLGGLFPGRWPELMRRNRELALAGRALLIAALGIPPPAPEEMLGSLASVPLPPAPEGSPAHELDPLQAWLFERHRIEVPVHRWPDPELRLLRISAQAYNELEEYRALARALGEAPELLG